jgi:predicted transcriptional regulator
MPMLPRKRKAQLIERGVKVSDIAKQVGFSQPFVSRVLHGTRRNAAVEQVIADASGKPVQRVFGKPQQRVA